MRVENMRAEFADEAPLVDHLPDQMRWVEIHPDLAFPRLDDAAPDHGRISYVVPTRPFVIAENDRAVLERQPDVVVAGVSDDVRPDLKRFLPVCLYLLRRVAAAEGVDQADAHSTRGHNDLLQVLDDGLTVGMIRMQRVRII